jgi:NAD(P)H-dependent FMN reductase
MAGPHVVAVAGSLRDRSYTRLGLEIALEGVEAAGGTGDLIDLRGFDLPPLDPDDDPPADAERFAGLVREADAVLLGTPMYHGSYSGVLKNAVDYCGFDEFENTTVGLLAVAGGSFPVTALEHLRSVCRALNAWEGVDDLLWEDGREAGCCPTRPRFPGPGPPSRTATSPTRASASGS